MSTVVLFVAIIALIALFAVFFVCYQAQQRERESEAANQAAFDMPSAAVIYSRRSYPTPITRPIQYHHRYSSKAPTPYTVIGNLPCYLFDASQAQGYGNDEKEKPQCVICCCDYEQDDKLKILPCLHKYHEECIDAWLNRDHICPICQADVVLAAGLSMRDWSAHTLESVNVVSGATSPAPSTPVPAAASPASYRPAAAAAANPRHATATSGRPATAPAATQAANSSSSSSSSTANSRGTDDASNAVSSQHVMRTAEALAATIAALPSSSQQQQQQQQVQQQQQQEQRWQQNQHHTAEEQQGRMLTSSSSSSAAAARGDIEAQDATGQRGRDNSSSSADGRCFVRVGDVPDALCLGDGDCGSAGHVAITIQHPAAARAAGAASK